MRPPHVAARQDRRIRTVVEAMAAMPLRVVQLERVRQLTGVYPMIYTSPGGWNSRFGGDGNVVAQSGYGLLWVADWRGP